jgi:hypothetical protein
MSMVRAFSADSTGSTVGTALDYCSRDQGFESRISSTPEGNVKFGEILKLFHAPSYTAYTAWCSGALHPKVDWLGSSWYLLHKQFKTTLSSPMSRTHRTSQNMDNQFSRIWNISRNPDLYVAYILSICLRASISLGKCYKTFYGCKL